MKRRLGLALGVWLVLFLFPARLLAQSPSEEILEARITAVLEERKLIPPGGVDEQLSQKLAITVTKGSLRGQSFAIESGLLPLTNLPKYRSGDRIVVNLSTDEAGRQHFTITDYVRRDGLLALFILFVAVAVAVGRWQGLASLIGMGLTLVVIFGFILPQISAGHDPVATAITGSLLIVPVTFFLSHGLNKKTAVAVASTILTLIVTGILAQVFVGLTKLSGFASEEANFLQALRPGEINIRGLLLAGIIIGGLGIFDDITVSQAAIVAELKETAAHLGWTELFTKAMRIGRDHIASLVNTLFLVYAGAALPLLLLFVDSPRPLVEVINYEFIADEIVRTLVASIGLILAVPITTFLAAISYTRLDKRGRNLIP
jgi:uncharacterized membrane protein